VPIHCARVFHRTSMPRCFIENGSEMRFVHYILLAFSRRSNCPHAASPRMTRCLRGCAVAGIVGIGIPTGITLRENPSVRQSAADQSCVRYEHGPVSAGLSRGLPQYRNCTVLGAFIDLHNSTEENLEVPLPDAPAPDATDRWPRLGSGTEDG